ncbi:MAG: enoyl-CoA hydratase/isomerase family protein [Leucobacter sp.]|jgi:2-(1,2-epoxy-1,2-dihydrophenyl)acetyl-CoA isomerase|nr:enoyl-CoA hydratase/isomerase family protein [Leucobacter sp.]
MTDAILCEVQDGIARITFNRPERLNAFGEDLALAWHQISLDVAAREDVKVVLLAGNGRAFCAGGDVRTMRDLGFDGNWLIELADRINEGQLALIESAKPVIAAAHGTTAGGGLGVLLTSDYAVVGESSKIGSIYAKVGLTPDLTVSALLSRAIGERRALQMMLQDRMLSAAEALEWGLVAEVVADDQVLARAEEIARFLAESAPDARGQAKRLVRSAYGRSLAESVADEARTIGHTVTTADAQARITAFVQR